MEKIFYYEVSVRYKEDYFQDKNEPLEVVLGFSSTREQTIDSIQKVYRHAKVLGIKKITEKKFFKI